MAHSLDYTIDAKQIKIKQNPKEIRVKVTCGEVECSTTVYKMQTYKFSSLLHCRECQYNNDIVMKFSFDVEETHQQETLCAIIPFDKIRKYHTLFDTWITLFYENSERIAGAVLLCVWCSNSDASGIKESARKTATKDYFPTYHTTRALSSEVCPFNTALGHRSPSCM